MSQVCPRHLERRRLAPSPGLYDDARTAGWARTSTPLGAPAWLVTWLDEAREVLADPLRFPGPPLGTFPGDETPGQRVGSLLLNDPPEHTRLRRLVAGAFTVRRVEGLVPHISEIVETHLDRLVAAGPPADLVAGFAVPVPALVICELLGVPSVGRESLAECARRQLDLSLPVADRGAAMQESFGHMVEHVARVRRRPGEDLLGSLVREYGAGVGDPELVGLGMLLLLAGHETTANAIALSVLALLGAPDQLARLRADPAAVPAAVEELLRFTSPVNSPVVRQVAADTTVAGQMLAAGELVVVSLPVANRSPRLCGDPDELDITRAPSPHPAFGHGIHHCLGAALARAQLSVALPALLRCFPGLRRVDEVSYRGAVEVHGVDGLRVAWDTGGGRPEPTSE